MAHMTLELWNGILPVLKKHAATIRTGVYGGLSYLSGGFNVGDDFYGDLRVNDHVFRRCRVGFRNHFCQLFQQLTHV